MKAQNYTKILNFRNKLKQKNISLGTWMQIPSSTVAEILGQAGFDWITIDMEHGTFALHQLPDIFRAIELGNSLSLVRLANDDIKDCKQVLEAGASGFILPLIQNAVQLKKVVENTTWPPIGKRGIGFSRANLFGKHFNEEIANIQKPIIVAMIEDENGLNNLEEILQVKGLDAIFIGPYDLSASLGMIADFNNIKFKDSITKILNLCNKYNIACGIHVVKPDIEALKVKISEGYQFIAYSIDSVFLNTFCINPINE